MGRANNQYNKMTSVTRISRFDFVDVLKVVAIALIINSHSKWMYPDSLSMLGIGGAWGCALFFFVSGFTKANMKTDNFFLYVVKSALRIYPAVWIWYAFTWRFTDNFQWSYFVWPHYWFLQSILVYYVLFYPVIKYAKNKLGHLVIAGVLASLMCYLFLEHSAWLIDINMNPITKVWYFVIMIFGAYMRNCKSPKLAIGGGKLWSPRLLLLMLLFCSFIGCYGIKFIAQKYANLINLQLLFPVILFVACYLISTCCRDYTFKNVNVGKAVSFISARTLEIYIVQQLFIYDRFAEPITWIGAILVTLLCATALSWVCKQTFGRIKL